MRDKTGFRVPRRRKKVIAKFAPIKCYIGGSDIGSSLFHHEAGENIGLSMKVLLMADRRESLSVMEEDGRLTGIFICPNIYAGNLSRKIVQEFQPVDSSRRGPERDYSSARGHSVDVLQSGTPYPNAVRTFSPDTLFAEMP